MTEAPADLLLIDADMAGVDCLTVCEKVAACQRPSSLPIVVLTGRATFGRSTDGTGSRRWSSARISTLGRT